jgi:hypothetical protein
MNHDCSVHSVQADGLQAIQSQIETLSLDESENQEYYFAEDGI